MTNGPTEAVNNLIKRVKRVAFGFTRFRNYRIRVLLYEGCDQDESIPKLVWRGVIGDGSAIEVVAS